MVGKHGGAGCERKVNAAAVCEAQVKAGMSRSKPRYEELVTSTHILRQRCAEHVMPIVGQDVGAPLELSSVTPEAHTVTRSGSGPHQD